MKFKYQASLKRHDKKGRCRIGKNGCPKEIGNDFFTKYEENKSHSPPLFCDVFLGGFETIDHHNNNTNAFINYSYPSSIVEPQFSF